VLEHGDYYYMGVACESHNMEDIISWCTTEDLCCGIASTGEVMENCNTSETLSDFKPKMGDKVKIEVDRKEGLLNFYQNGKKCGTYTKPMLKTGSCHFACSFFSSSQKLIIVDEAE
jgi:hypothetical protein